MSKVLFSSKKKKSDEKVDLKKKALPILGGQEAHLPILVAVHGGSQGPEGAENSTRGSHMQSVSTGFLSYLSSPILVLFLFPIFRSSHAPIHAH